jgi:hypothetical protein
MRVRTSKFTLFSRGQGSRARGHSVYQCHCHAIIRNPPYGAHSHEQRDEGMRMLLECSAWPFWPADSSTEESLLALLVSCRYKGRAQGPLMTTGEGVKRGGRRRRRKGRRAESKERRRWRMSDG